MNCKPNRLVTTGANVKKYFRDNNLIDSYLNILDIGKFRAANTRWSQEANTQFLIDGRLFSEENDGRKAVPNVEMFQRIDAAKNIWYKENQWVKTRKAPIQNVVVKSIIDPVSIKSGKISSNIYELIPEITDDKIEEIYNNYISLMNIHRKNKGMSFDSFKLLLNKYQVYNFKDTFIFGQYDSKTATFITRVNSSPNSKELLAEAIPHLVEKGVDFLSFVPEDYANKLLRSGYTKSLQSFSYNFKGEKMQKFAVASNANVFKKIFGKDAKDVSAKEIEDYNKSIDLVYNSVNIDTSLINNIDKDLFKILETYLYQFGIKVSDIKIIQEQIGIDSIGFADMLSKVAYIKDKKDLPPIAGEFIAYMMQYNSLVKDIINELIQTDAILIPKNSYTLNEDGSKVYNYKKLNKDEFFKYIGKLIAEDLQNKLEGNYQKSLIQKIKDLIKSFFDYITQVEIDKINTNIGIISNNILQQNKNLITSSLYKPGAFGKPVKKVSIEDALSKDEFGASIIYALSKQGFILTGSTALSEQGTILRPDENPLHDIDWISPFSFKETEEKFFSVYPEAKHVRNIYNTNYQTQSYLVSPENTKIVNYKTESYENKIIISSYDIVDKNNNIVGTYRLQKQKDNNQTEEIETGVKGKVIDFFTYEDYSKSNENAPFSFKTKEGTILNLANWKDTFKAKLEFSRYKDIWDYNRFIPNENIVQQPQEIKPGVEELFNENETLANAVYEVLGFEIPTTKLQGKKKDSQGNIITFDVIEELTSNERKDLPESILLKKLFDGKYIPKTKNGDILLGSQYKMGSFSPGSNLIEVKGANKDIVSKILNHELLHAVTYNIIKNYQAYVGERTIESIEKDVKYKKINLTEKQINSLNELTKLKNKVITYYKNNSDNIQDKYPDLGKSDYFIKAQYSEADLDEFISEVFSNPNLIEVLKQIPSEGKKSNLFKDFVDAISKILGFTNTSILEDIVAYSEEAFFAQPQITPQQKQQALQLYSQYLDTIFPDSKVKDIVYHGTDKELKKFYDNLRSGIHFGTLKQAEGRRRATDFEFKKNAKFISAIIDLKNPLKTKDFDWEKAGDAFTSWQPGDDLSDLDFTEYLISSGIIKEEEIQDAEGDFDLINKKGYDGVIYKNEGAGEKTGENSYAVSKSEQIHILGSKQDIEGFKEFVGKKEKPKTIEANYYTYSLYASELTEEEFNSLTTEEQIKLIEQVINC